MPKGLHFIAFSLLYHTPCLSCKFELHFVDTTCVCTFLVLYSTCVEYGGPEVHSRFPFLVSTFALICASRFPFVLICASRFPFLIPPSFVPRVSRSSSFVLRVCHFSFRPHLCLTFPVRPHLCFAFPISHSALICASRIPFVLICASRFPFLIPPSFVPRISCLPVPEEV